MLVRMSFTITMAIFGAGLICFFMFGCGAAPPLYVIDVQKLAGAVPATAESLLYEMVPCQLKHEERWEEGQTDVQDIIGKLFMRVYEINNGQIDRWQRKPMVELYFNADYEERVNGVDVAFIGYLSPTYALRRLGYDAKTTGNEVTVCFIDAPRRLGYDPDDAWYFITKEYLHQVYLRDTGQSTSVTIHLDALTH